MQNHCWEIFFLGNIEIAALAGFDFLRKARAENPKIRLGEILEILKVGSISFKKYEMGIPGDLVYGINIFRIT